MILAKMRSPATILPPIRCLDTVSFDSSPGGIARGILMLARPVIDEDFFSREKVRGSQEIHEKWDHRDASSE
jgi:hypothetical protein